MEQFNVNADRIIIRFNSAENGEEIELDVTKMPIPNYSAETINGSGDSSEEQEFESDIDGHIYRTVVYKNMSDGNVVVFDDTDDVEIVDFEIKETIAEDKDTDIDNY